MSLQAAQATAPGEAPGLSSAHTMGNKVEVEGGGEAENVWDCGSPLYDSYELASLGHLLDRNRMALLASSPRLELSSSSANSDLGSTTKAEAFCLQRSSGKKKKKMRDKNEVARMFRSGFSAFVRSVMKK